MTQHTGTAVTTLSIEGMTCASCVARVERRLQSLDGVAAEVNLATEQARVTHPTGADVGELVRAVASAGYTARVQQQAAQRSERENEGDAGQHTTDAGASVSADEARLRQRLIVSAILAVPVIVLAMIPAWQFTSWQWLSLTLASPVVFWGGYPFHRSTWVNLRHGAVTMDTLITMGTGAAYLWSVWALFFGMAGMPGVTHSVSLFTAVDPASTIYLEVAAGVTVFLLLGRYIELRSKRRAGDALRALQSLGAKRVTVLRDAPLDTADLMSPARREIEIDTDDLAVGDLFIVRPGERIATDGVVVGGEAAVDESMLTGESVPVEVGPDDVVTGSTIVSNGRLIVRATRIGSETRLAQIAKLVEDAQLGKGRVQRLADRVSAIFVPVVIAVAIVTAAVWIIAGASTAGAFTASVAVLIIACPCALGLATPVALLVGTSRGAQLGILITGPESLERANRIDTVALDKTGTVTTGAMSLERVTAVTGPPEEALALAAAVEADSEHPVARAIVRAADGLPMPTTSGFVASAGLGASADVDGARVFVGRPDLSELIDAEPVIRAAVDAAHGRGSTVALVKRDETPIAVLEVSDGVKEGAADAIARLRRLGLRPVLITGDNEHAAARAASLTGIDEVHAGVSPERKVLTIEELQSSGGRVAMVGDGVNDAAALARADLGIAMGGGTDAAIQASDITIVAGDPTRIPDAIALSRKTLGTIRGNLFWAFAYNVAAIPLAAAGLLNPMIAGAAMAFSSVFVVLNSLRLRRFSPKRTS